MPTLAKLIVLASHPGLSQLSGSLPEEWGSPTAFTQLSILSLANLSVQGKPSERGTLHIALSIAGHFMLHSATLATRVYIFVLPT